MAKRNNGRKPDKLDKLIMRNWIICGVSFVLIIVLMFFFK